MSSHATHSRLILGLFFCSGATALIYEVVWSKFLSQMFGSTVQAQTMVLAAFMGGLALGNHLLGRCADRLREPVRVYGFIELAIGLYALSFVTLYGMVDRVFVAVGSRFLEQPGWLLVLKGALGLVLLIVPTTLMGGTLPLLAAWLQNESDEAGRRSARFYSMNSLGAVVGAGLAGFYLVQNLGMVVTLQVTALANSVIGGLAVLASRASSGEVPSSAQRSEVDAVPDASPPCSLPAAAALVAITGGIAMGLEVLASRSLVLVFGSSLQSFAVVLIAFILGIGLGSALVSSPRWRRVESGRLMVLLLLAAALWLGLMVCNLEGGVEFYRRARTGLARTNAGYFLHQMLTGGLSLVMLGVPAGLIGAVLPLMMRLISGSASGLGAGVGRLLTWNTLGAVLGVLLTGFVLMPRIGLRASFGFLLLSLCVVAFLVAWRQRLTPGIAGSGAVAVLLGTMLTLSGDGWRHVMSSGVFRARETEADPNVLGLRKKHIKIVFYEDAPDATVSVEHGDGVGAPSDIGLRINGKADASSHRDLSTQLLVGHLPLLAKPGAKDVFILGLGSGITAGAVLAHPVSHVTVAENCEPVVRAARFFSPWNRGVLTNPLVRIRVEDARTLLKLDPQQYDVIITQPSNPWMVGVGSVFSREYYELAASRLREGGMVVQWVQIYDMHDGIVSLVLRTFGSVFPHMEIWDTEGGDLVLLGSMKPWPQAPAHFQAAFDRPLVRQDLGRLGFDSAASLLARQLASQQTAFAIAGEGPIQSDWNPILEYEAPRAFFLGRDAKQISLFDERTWQGLLAGDTKRLALAALDVGSLQRIFSEFGTVNLDLRQSLRYALRRAQERGKEVVALDPIVPSLLAAASSRGPIPLAAITNLETAVALLMDSGQNPGPELKAAAELIESALNQSLPASAWSPQDLGALAARARLAEGDVTRARAILEKVMTGAPPDLQLGYLARIAGRGAPPAFTAASLASKLTPP